MIPRKKTKKLKEPQKKHYVILNSDLNYFCGFTHGGKFSWKKDFSEAKYFTDEHKFKMLTRWYPNEIMMDWVD
jgi:hypothetical protein